MTRFHHLMFTALCTATALGGCIDDTTDLDTETADTDTSHDDPSTSDDSATSAAAGTYYRHCATPEFRPQRYQEFDFFGGVFSVCWGNNAAGNGTVTFNENGYGGLSFKVQTFVYTDPCCRATQKSGTVGWGSGGFWDTITTTRAGNLISAHVKVCYGFSCDEWVFLPDGNYFHT